MHSNAQTFIFFYSLCCLKHYQDITSKIKNRKAYLLLCDFFYLNFNLPNQNCRNDADDDTRHDTRKKEDGQVVDNGVTTKKQARHADLGDIVRNAAEDADTDLAKEAELLHQHHHK